MDPLLLCKCMSANIHLQLDALHVSQPPEYTQSRDQCHSVYCMSPGVRAVTTLYEQVLKIIAVRVEIQNPLLWEGRSSRGEKEQDGNALRRPTMPQSCLPCGSGGLIRLRALNPCCLKLSTLPRPSHRCLLIRSSHRSPTPIPIRHRVNGMPVWYAALRSWMPSESGLRGWRR